MPRKKRTKNGVVGSIEGGTYTRKEHTGPSAVILQGNICILVFICEGYFIGNCVPVCM